MMPAFEYVHAIEGRLRIKVPEVKNSPRFAERIERLFLTMDGIDTVRANPVTGNVLFLHDPDRVAPREIMAILIAAGYMGMGIDGGQARPESAGEAAEAIAWVICRVLSHAWKGLVPAPGLIEQLVESAVQFLVRLVVGRVAAALA